MDEIAKIVLGFLSGGGVGLLLFYRSKRRKENADASVVEHNAYSVQIAHLTKQLKDSFTELDHMQDIIDKKREQIIILTRKVGELELKLIDAEHARRRIEYYLCMSDKCQGRLSSVQKEEKQ